MQFFGIKFIEDKDTKETKIKLLLQYLWHLRPNILPPFAKVKETQNFNFKHVYVKIMILCLQTYKKMRHILRMTKNVLFY